MAEARFGSGRGQGRVVLVGAGPGDPDLITLRGVRALREADVVLYDELATDELLDHAPPHAMRINVGKRGHDEPTRTQAEINALLVDHARAGRRVVRLKGGDPFVFGRGGEELSACAEAGVAFEVVPGVSAAIAVLGYAGIPVTDRRHSASFAVVTGHKDPSRAAESTRWRELATAVDTLVILMGMRNLERLVDELLAGGKPGDTPAAAIMQGTLPEQRTCVSTLAGLPEAVRAAGLGAPAAIVVGDVVSLRESLVWWERRPLFGRSVLVTRAREQVDELAAALRSAGALPVVRPMIELAEVEDEASRGAIRAVLERIGTYHAVVFTSSNAVRFFARAHAAAYSRANAGADARAAATSLVSRGERGRLRPALAPTTRVFCIGERTAEEALRSGYPVNFVASGRSDAGALLAEIAPLLRAPGERVLIPRSRIAATTIADGLREAGVEVDSIAFYENRIPPVDRSELAERLSTGRLDALTFTSPSTAENFVACLDEAGLAAARRCMIAAIGTTTAKRLAELGLPADAVPERPDVGELVAALARVAAERTR